ncbi:FAD-dependent oxidoreductase [Ekhidna sp.]
MDRRKFIKGTSIAAISLPFWLQSCKQWIKGNFPVYINSDHGAGHLMMESRQWNKAEGGSTQTIIVGGGLAGISAASRLGDDFLLFELSNRLGGTSAAKTFDELTFSQGAHYELAYPETYGSEVLQLFEQLDIIKYEPWKKSWTFKDRQHVIPFQRRQQCFEDGKRRKEVIEDGASKDQFYRTLDRYAGTMHLPTRLINEEFRDLNELTFWDFLSYRINTEVSFKRQLDYHMMDDWGGRSDQVSALAGIHYFMCRPYLNQSVDLFSPPQGNQYFLDRIATKVHDEKIKKNHLVSRIEKVGDSYSVEVIDVLSEKVKTYKAENIIYAGQKHALKYVYPKDSGLFDQQQAPWMVMNFVCEGTPKKYGYWQNEYIGENPAFLGFIDSSVQDQQSQRGKRIITAYYCLQPEDRNYLTTIPDHKEDIAQETLSYISEMLDENLEIEACHINVMGHAMSIPSPGFLFNDVNDKGADLIYAGVDNGRLPLLYEAVDSGIMAALKLS